MSLATKLRELVASRGLSQCDVIRAVESRGVDVPPSSLSRWLSGSRPAPVYAVRAILDVCGVPPADRAAYYEAL